MKKLNLDGREPVLKKVACYFARGNGDYGFSFFERVKKERVRNGDVFIYNEGILWKI